MAPAGSGNGPVTLRTAHELTPIASWGDILYLADQHGVDDQADEVWWLERVEIAELQQDLGLDDDPEERAKLEEMRVSFGQGDRFPPLVLQHVDTGLSLWDGIHRATAAHRAGLTSLPAWVAHIDGCCPLAGARRLEVL